MFSWFFKKEEDNNTPVVVHYGEGFAVRRKSFGGYEYFDIRDKNYWWTQQEGITRYAITSSLEEAQSAALVAIKHNTPVKE